MTKLSRIVADFSKLIDTPFSPLAISLLEFPHEDGFVPIDHLNYLNRPGRRLEPYYHDRPSYGTRSDHAEIKRLTALDAMEGHIHRRLGHIVVNPHDPYNTAALIQSYCPSNIMSLEVAQFDGNISYPVANSSTESEEHFINSVVHMAQEQARLLGSNIDAQGKAITTDRAAFLFAAKGAGKTFFLNYLLSKYSTFFDSKKIIWVRINLVNDLSYDSRLQDWINAQAAKIVLRYYNSKSLHFKKPMALAVDVERYLTEQVYPRHAKRRVAEIKLTLNKAKVMFEEGGFPESGVSDEVLGDETIPPDLALWTVAAARRSGFAFVCVLDGLDLLEITRAYRRRFDLLCSQAIDLINSKKRSGFALVVVMRTTTLMNVLKPDFPDAFDQSEGAESAIAAVPVADAITRRIEYLRTEIPTIAAEKSIDWDIARLPAHLEAFVDFMNGEDFYKKGDKRTNFLEALEDIQGANLRAKMHMVQYKYFEFIAKGRHNRTTYHAVETLMKAGRRFPPIPYRYYLDASGCNRSLWHKQKYDSRFLPSLFRFPFVGARGGNRKQAATIGKSGWKVRLDYLLLGVRVLQLLDFQRQFLLERLRVGRQRLPAEMIVGDVLDILEKMFLYDRRAALAVMEEFYEFQLIDFQNSNLQFENVEAMEDNEIVCLPKMDLLLGRMLSDLAYVNMAAMRLPMPGAVFSERETPLLRAASYEDASDPLGFWLATKLCNAASVSRLVSLINGRQELAFRGLLRSGLGNLENRKPLLQFSIEHGLFSVADLIKREMKEQVAAAVSGVQFLDERLDEIESGLRQYIENWT